MGFCLQIRRGLALSGVLALAGISLPAAARNTAPIQPRVRSVVKADARTGRLIRTFVISARVTVPVVQTADSDRPGAAYDSVEFINVPEIVEATAKKYDVDPLLVHAVIQVESGYNQVAVSPKGAQGLMQLMPGTARRFGVRNSFDVRENIEGGVRYLRYLNGLFPNDIRLAIAAYNAGEAAVWKYKNTIPPYRETEQYVQKVGMRYSKAQREAAGRAPLLTSETTAAAGGPESVNNEPVFARVESFVDSEGRLHLRTLPIASVVSTP